MTKIKAAVISNAIEGIENYFVGNEKIEYEFIEVSKDFNPNLQSYDLLIVPNGSDNIAMAKIKNKVADFLNNEKSLFCFDGWFTDWIPGNQWIMNNELKSIDLRYSIKSDPYNLFENVDINELIYNHKISGWWACGYIQTSPNAIIVMEDTWQRPIIAIDETTTKGTIVMTASGPLGNGGAIPTEEKSNENALTQLYRNMVEMVYNKINTVVAEKQN